MKQNETREMIVKMRGPASVSLAEIAYSLEALGIEVLAVPQHGTGKHNHNCKARRIDLLPNVLPFALR